MFIEIKEKMENFFDQANDVLEKRKDFHLRLDDPEYGDTFRRELRKAFDRKLKEKRIGGLKLQAKVCIWAVIVLLVLLIYAAIAHHFWTRIICYVGIIVCVWNHISAVHALCKPLAEADLEASRIVDALIRGMPQSAPEPSPTPEQSTTAQATRPSGPLTQRELLAQGARQARQRSQS